MSLDSNLSGFNDINKIPEQSPVPADQKTTRKGHLLKPIESKTSRVKQRYSPVGSEISNTDSGSSDRSLLGRISSSTISTVSDPDLDMHSFEEISLEEISKVDQVIEKIKSNFLESIKIGDKYYSKESDIHFKAVVATTSDEIANSVIHKLKEMGVSATSSIVHNKIKSSFERVFNLSSTQNLVSQDKIKIRTADQETITSLKIKRPSESELQFANSGAYNLALALFRELTVNYQEYKSGDKKYDSNNPNLKDDFQLNLNAPNQDSPGYDKQEQMVALVARMIKTKLAKIVKDCTVSKTENGGFKFDIHLNNRSEWIKKPVTLNRIFGKNKAPDELDVLVDNFKKVIRSSLIIDRIRPGLKGGERHDVIEAHKELMDNGMNLAYDHQTNTYTIIKSANKTLDEMNKILGFKDNSLRNREKYLTVYPYVNQKETPKANYTFKLQPY